MYDYQNGVYGEEKWVYDSTRIPAILFIFDKELNANSPRPCFLRGRKGEVLMSHVLLIRYLQNPSLHSYLPYSPKQ